MTTATTVYLLGAEAEVSDPAGSFTGVPPTVCLSGLFDVIEFLPVEPSNYVYSPTWLLVPAGADQDQCYAVDASIFDEQVNPRAYARLLEQEREMALQEEAS